MGVLIGADFVPTASNSHLFERGNIEDLIGVELYEMFCQADYRIVNLELPLTDKEQPIEKCGPNLSANTNTINGYKKLKIDMLTLANNHILDQGSFGVYSTIKTLENEKIQFIGLAGEKYKDNSFSIFEFQCKKIAVYACAEHEFSTLERWEIKANPYEEKATNDTIKHLAEQYDYIIVLYHGGKEYYRYPSPCLQTRCRNMVLSGANLVVCQHSHCIGCEERYKGGTIVYGQGNFLFDISNNEYCQTGLLIEINSRFEISYIPLKKNGHCVSVANGEDGIKILNDFYKRSRQIEEETFVKDNYNRFSREIIETYLWSLSGKESFLFRALNKLCRGKLRSNRLKRKYNKESLMKIYNCLICEAHKELLVNCLEKKIYE